MRAITLVLCATFALRALQAEEKPLEIYFIDVEGGQATLFVPPHGQSFLIDTGWGYNAYRDANRIAAVAKKAKIKKIDYVLITHYHSDHVGGVPQMITKIPVGAFIDHGPNREDSKTTATLYRDYQDATSGVKHITAKPGDRLPIKDLDVTVVAADGNVLTAPLADAGQPNSACSGIAKKETDPSENARSVGVIIRYGTFRVADLGDLTWNKELELMCPANKLGKVDLFVVSHHGLDQSNSPALVRALAPRVAIMDNGAKKGASPAAWETVKTSPGLIDLWQLHYADEAGGDHNSADPFIANTTEADTGLYLQVMAKQDGTFAVYNARNKVTKQYR